MGVSLILLFFGFCFNFCFNYYEKRSEEREKQRIRAYYSTPFEWIIVETGENLIESEIYKIALSMKRSDFEKYAYSYFEKPLLLYCPIHDYSEYVSTYKQVIETLNRYEKFANKIKLEIEHEKKLEDDARKINEIKKNKRKKWLVTFANNQII